LSELDSPDALVTQSEPVSPRDAQESFLTLVDPSLVREGAVKFEPGELVAARYRIIEALGDSNLGRNFRAHDQTRATDVKIIVLHEAIALSTETLSALERIVELLAPRPHEYVQRVDAIETLEGATFLVLEWCEGASLVELLRVRREMTAEETVSLLGPAAGALDHVLACGLDEVDLALPQVNVVFSQKPGTGWMKTPLREWPAHTVKINPLNSRAVTAAGETWAGGQTLVDGPRADRGGAAARAVRALAAIAYEALGGKLSPAALANQGVQFKPLAALTEAGNEVLRCALSRDPGFPSVSSFIGALATPENAGLAYRATPEPLTEARTRARRSEATSVPTPTEPSVSPARTPGETAPARKGSPLPIFVLLAVVASGGALWYFKFALKPVAPPSSSISTPAATPNPSSESEVSPSPSPSPEAVRREMLAAAMKEARALEAKQSWAECLAAWVKIVQDFPESEAGKTNLETVCNTLRSRPDGIGGDAFAPLREPLANAAQLDVLSAMMVLAENLRRTAPGESLHWFQRAGELGDLEGLTQAGLMISNDQDDPQRFEKAVALFQRAAEKGHLSAKTSLGECLLYGKGIEKNEAGALEMLQQAAAANDRRAHDLLGTYYVKEARTSGRRESEANELFGKAAKHFERAADLGLVRALGNLGVLHINGQGVPKDPRRAFALIQKGAEGKEAFCMVLLAQCYESGTGVSAPNLQKAREWYQLAADAGNAKAAEWIKSKGVTPAPNP
jgi:TPR repeat protein